MADGGEGTVEAIVAAGNGQLRRNHVQGPLGAPVEAHWGWLPDSHTAIIEMAEASGLQLLKPEQRNACITSTFGTGELIRAALDAGARRVILAIGGSATNDAGAGACSTPRATACRAAAWHWPMWRVSNWRAWTRVWPKCALKLPPT